MFIRSERLFLRPGWPEDWQELHTRIADEGVVRNLARAPWPYTADHAREFAGRTQQARFPHFFVTLPGTDGARLVGVCGIHESGRGTELGYWIAREFWNRGFATEAARAMLTIARVLGHARIHASHFVDNPASGRVLRKLCFTPTRKRGTLHSPGREAPAEMVSYVRDLAGDCDGDAMLKRAA